MNDSGRDEEMPSQEGRPTHAPDGTDLTLIRWMLSLTPAERLEVLESGSRSLALLMNARKEVGRENDLAVLPLLRRTLEARGDAK